MTKKKQPKKRVGPKADPKWLHGKDRQAAIALMRIYGNKTEVILNALQSIAARIAIGAGVSPDSYAKGYKHHWDIIVSAILATREASSEGPPN